MLESSAAKQFPIVPWLRLTRPFTLLPPMLGVASGAVTAFGSAWNPDPDRAMSWAVVWTVLIGTACAGLMNAASNVVNQLYDLEIDRINKPHRPLVTGELSVTEAWRASVALYLVALLPTWLVAPWPATTLVEKATEPLIRHECFLLFLLGLVATLVYSVPALGRTKARGLWANLTIALPRGMLLRVAGWSTVASVFHIEPWFIGLIFFLFLLGAASTKDFSDIDGDSRGGCDTLPIRYGVGKAARMIAPSFVLPWLLIPLGAVLPDPLAPQHTVLTGNAVVLTGLGLGLAAWGSYVVHLVVRDPEALARSENHPSWTHMYLMMMVGQVGFAVAYLL